MLLVQLLNVSNKNGKTPLHSASYYDHEDIVGYLRAEEERKKQEK